jgi:predicted  nucleic acid-binding Zn-ribbon protein
MKRLSGNTLCSSRDSNGCKFCSLKKFSYPDRDYASKNRTKDYNTDILTLQRLGQEMFMPPGKTYSEYERKIRIEEKETRAKSPERMKADEDKRKSRKEDQLSVLTNDAIFSLADGDDSGPGFLEKGIQDE